MEKATEIRYIDLMVEQNPDVVCQYSLDKRIAFISQAIQKITNNPPAYYVGKAIAELGYSHFVVKKFDEAFDECVRTRDVVNIELYLNERIFSEVYFSIRFVPVLQDGQPVAVVTFSRNITHERDLASAQQNEIDALRILSQRLIKKANKLQDFAYIISHDMRAPVANIQGLMQILADANNQEERDRFFDLLKGAVARLDQTIANLNEVVNINQSIEVQTEMLDFEAVLHRTRANLATLIADTRTENTCDFTACPHVSYPKPYLESLFLNLTTNGIKYRHAARMPRLHFKSYWYQGAPYLACQDNGVGIDLERHGDKIFGLHMTFHGNQDARGVGLFVTKNQVEAMGGKIYVESRVGEGTTFTIQFMPAVL